MSAIVYSSVIVNHFVWLFYKATENIHTVKVGS